MLEKDRRPIAARDTGWAKKITKSLIGFKLSPNRISMLSVLFSILGAAALFFPQYFGYVVCALMVQMRLLCNLFDGMVALELNQDNPLGKIYNEFPDRVTDSIFLITVGYAFNCAELGLIAALLAALTAYVRVFGGSVGLVQDFMGPMAKQHRMAVLTAALLFSQAELYINNSTYIMLAALYIISVGSALTCVTRTVKIAKLLKEQK